MYAFCRALLFELPPEAAHTVALKGLKWLHRLDLVRPFSHTPDQPVQCMGLTFPSPMGLAAGVDKNGDYIDALAALGSGFIEVGGVTPKPQPGNPKPRLFRLKKHDALINRFDFNSKGVEHLVKNLKQRKTEIPVGVNLAKNSNTPVEQATDDYAICMEQVYPYADFVTLNISCPNSEGLTKLQTEKAFEKVIKTMKQKHSALAKANQRSIPLLVKVSPDLSQTETKSIAKICLKHKVDGIIATNASKQRKGVSKDPLAKETGGLSGPVIADQSRQVLKWLKAEIKDKPCALISLGGIDSTDEAAKRLQLGADLVQAYTGFVYQGPKLFKRIPHG